MRVARARPWLHQGASDLRIAQLLFHYSDEDGADEDGARATIEIGRLRREDAGCHIAAMCAQTIEKSIKGYMFLNGSAPALDHRPDKYLAQLLIRKGGGVNPLLHHASHQATLSKVLIVSTRAVVKELLDLTPGARGNQHDLPNTEYPWTEQGEWRCSPCGAPAFAKVDDWQRWLKAAKKVHNGLFGLFEAVQRENIN